MNYCFGVDIGGTTVKIGLFQTDGELVDKWEIKTRTENEGEAILPDVAEALKKKMEEKGLAPDDIRSSDDLYKLPFVTKADRREASP